MDLNEDNAKKACTELDGETDYAVANVAEEASVQEAINKTIENISENTNKVITLQINIECVMV